MQQKQPFFLFTFGFLSALHILFVNFYPRIYAYMNMSESLPRFLMLSTLIRGFLLIGIILAGFTCVRENRRFLPFYLGLFLINFLLFFLI